jgi:hypothetical protein
MAETTTAAPAEPTTAVARRDDGDLYRPPIFDQIDPRKLALVKAQIAPGCTDGEVGHFLELCAHYDLDAFAREAWCAKSKTGKLLIMVGRDGLRKIGQRNGLHIDGDVGRANDEFTICRTPDGNRTVQHSYSSPAKRGDIVGAWAECRLGGPMGKPMGYFYAPLSEYLPRNISDHSPWSKQVGVMILAAAERQAIRQATPLGGLLAEGEDALVDENARGPLGDGTGDGQAAGLDLGPDVEALIARAQQLGHAGLAERGTIELLLGGKSEEAIAEWVRKANRELDEMPVDAEVVPEADSGDLRSNIAQTGEHARCPADAPQAPTGAAQPVESPWLQSDQERIEALRRRGSELLAEAEALRDAGDPRADEVFEELERIEAEVDAASNVNQGSLPL